MPRSSADQLREMLAENATLTARSGEHRAAIRRAAAEEEERIETRLQGLTGGQVFTDEVNQHEYRRLIRARARLQLIGRGTRS